MGVPIVKLKFASVCDRGFDYIKNDYSNDKNPAANE